MVLAAYIPYSPIKNMDRLQDQGVTNPYHLLVSVRLIVRPAITSGH